MADPRREYRADVQALRAAAVTAVVGYHLWPHALRGGFVGVDVFYAISGYLITGQLVREAGTNGRIAPVQFWARRIRRLLPAASLVLVASLVLMVALLPRLAWAENVLETRASALYVENWLLARHAVDYLAAGQSASLVQHYWSLSVEEQFYLFWPLLLLLALRVPVGSVRRRSSAALLLVFVGSLAWSIADTASDPRTAFFATTTRGWEFALGGLVALAGRRSPHGSSARGRTAAARAGWAAIAAATVLISGDDPFPGVVALLPVGGAAVVLWSDVAALRWTDLRFVRWIGDNSYSIYLWHWPLIVAAPWAFAGHVGTTVKVGIAAASLLLAGLTRRWIEDPIRFGRRRPRRALPAYVAAIVGIGCITAATATPWLRAVPDRAAARANAAARARNFERPVATLPSSSGPSSGSSPAGSPPSSSALPVGPVSCYGAGAMVFLSACPHAFDRPPGLDTAFAEEDGRTYDCLAPAGTTSVDLCRFGRTHAPTRTIAVVGNSHARRLVPALDAYGRRHGWEVVDATEINCMGVVTVPIGSESPDNGCLLWSKGVVHRLLALPHLDAVVFASFSGAVHFLTGSWSPSATDRAAASRAMIATWTAFARRGVRVIVTEDVPGMRPRRDPECLAASTARHDPCAMPERTTVRSNIMDRTARAHPDVATYLPLRQYFCDGSRCHALIGGLVVYFDTDHLTATYSRSLAPYLGAQIARVLR